LECLKGGVDVSINAWISLDLEVSKTIYCRTRQEGDLYQKLGSSGKKSVKKLMIDHKIPQPCRDSLPLILIGKDEVVWIPGLPPSEKFKVQPTTKRVMHLTYSPCQT
jgi:tRNA(Ile)-lysidine synthase